MANHLAAIETATTDATRRELAMGVRDSPVWHAAWLLRFHAVGTGPMPAC